MALTCGVFHMYLNHHTYKTVYIFAPDTVYCLPRSLGQHLSLDLLRRPIRHLRATNLSASLASLDPARHTNVRIPQELPQHQAPAIMPRQRRVKFVRNGPQLRQPRPGHGGKIVVLVVVTDVVCEDIQRAVVAVRLGNGDVVVWVGRFGSDGSIDVVLGDEVAGSRVPGACEEG